MTNHTVTNKQQLWSVCSIRIELLQDIHQIIRQLTQTQVGLVLCRGLSFVVKGQLENFIAQSQRTVTSRIQSKEA